MTAHTTLLFDLDGTLTDPKPGITASVQYALAQFGVQEDDLDTLTPFIGPPLRESFQRYYGLSASEAERAVAYYREMYTEHRFVGNAVYMGIPELLTLLCAQGKRLLVATSKPTELAKEILEHFGLAAYFDLVVGSYLDGRRSTKTEVIAHVLATIPETPRGSIVMIGDREHDILGAQAHGIASVAVGYGYGSLAELFAARPGYFAHTIRDLTILLRD